MADILTRVAGPVAPSRSDAGTTIYTPKTGEIVAVKNAVLANSDPLKGAWAYMSLGAMTTKANIVIPGLFVPPATTLIVPLDFVMNGGTETLAARQVVDMSYSKLQVATAVAVINSTTDASTYATAGWAGVASTAYLMCVTVVDAAAAAAPTSFTDTHDGVSWTQVGTSIGNAAATMNMSFWRCQLTGTTNTTTTANFAAAMDGCHIVIAKLTNADVTGTNGSEAVQDGGTLLHTDVTGTAIVHPGNSICGARFAAVSSNAGSTSTAGAGFTELSDAAVATPTNMLSTEYSITPGATADFTLATTSTDKMTKMANIQDGSTPLTIMVNAVVIR